MSVCRWQNKNAIVCGASTGLGFELARKLASEQARTLIVARNTNRLDDAARELTTSFPGSQVFSLAIDVSRIDGAARLAQWLSASDFGPIDLLVNAVGQSDRGTIMQLSPTRMRELFDTNVISTILVSQQVRPFLRKPISVIVNIGSLASLFAPRYLGGYSAAKHALAAITQQMRLELASEGVHVMLACPGPIRRTDVGDRYRGLPGTENLPLDAHKGGGGAKLKGLDPSVLAQEILVAAAKRKCMLVRPSKARLLHILSAVSSKMGDYVLRRMST